MTLRRAAFVWDNFGPLHADRCNSAARLLQGQVEVIGIELFPTSDLYDWQSPEAQEFEKQTLFAQGNWADHSSLTIASRIVEAVKQSGCDGAFLCHYNETAILLAAIRLRNAGVAVFTMGCSKEDDAPRSPIKEWVKRQFYRPYLGGIGSERRSTAYMQKLGLPAGRVMGGYNCVDQDRIRAMADIPAQEEPPFDTRPFLVVARLIWEKNLPALLRAYAAYCRLCNAPRRLQIAGSGPLEGELKTIAHELEIDGLIDWLGFVQTEKVALLMRDALCLILPSISETFGNVVPEALAFNLPVLISTQCGAADCLVKDGVSGFTFEAQDENRLTELMQRISADQPLWQELRKGAGQLAPLGHSAVFARSVANLVRD